MIVYVFNKVSELYARMRFQKQELGDQHILQELKKDISWSNAKRAPYVLVFVLLFVLAQLINDFFNTGLWTTNQLLFFRINDLCVLFVFTVLFILFINRKKTNNEDHYTRNNTIVHLHIISLLIYSAVISSAEQYKFHHTPTFAITSLLISILYYLSGWSLLIYYLLGLLLLVLNPYKILVENNLQESYYSISYMVVPISWMISRILLFTRRESFLDRYYLAGANNDLERQVIERTRELHDANANLQNRIAVQLEYEKDLEKAKLKAEESDRLKSAFLANMSHEVRTPLNAIMGFAELLSKSVPTDDKSRNYTDILKGRCDDLLKIMDDIIMMSKIESGQMEVYPEFFSVRNMFQMIMIKTQQKIVALNKGGLKLRMNVNLDEKTDAIYTDKIKFNQIFGNLIDNAIKFTDQGSIEFGCESYTNKALLFHVSDTGIGISEETKSVVFEKFRQIEQGLNRKYDGMGLGLSISKEFVERQGGKIWMDSIEDKGTSVFFTLPCLPVADKQIEYKEKKYTRKKSGSVKILIIEDDVASRSLFQEMLKGLPVQLEFAYTGNKAIQMIENGLQFDLVLMDIHLPDINGFELTRRIKKLDKNIPVIAQSAYFSEEALAKCFAAGCDDYIPKPIDMDRLLSMIKSMLEI